MNVVNQRQKLRARLHQQRLETPLKESPLFPAEAIEARGEGSLQPTHSLGEVAIGSAQTKMKMIPHQAERLNLPTKALTGFPQNLPESLTSAFSLEDEPTEIPAIDHMMAGVATDHSERARHLHAEVTCPTDPVKPKN